VKEPPKNPPTMSCTASPTSLQAGATATITCDCKSPDNVQVNVAGWNATGGTLSGTGNTATLNTAGASPGAITVSATCTDSRGLTASTNSQVTVEAPPPPPPQSSKLSECSYPNKTKPWRVDNTCKAVLDDVAQALKNQADAKLVVVGFADPDELKKRKNLAGERAVDVKAYLSGGEAKQAIDPSRIETRTASGGQKTEHWIVPPGASFTEPDTQSVDENTVKPIPDHPAAKKKPAKKAQ
jgi:outer membrane protein OmpA-like peptidoglycan-associated protein